MHHLHMQPGESREVTVGRRRDARAHRCGDFSAVLKALPAACRLHWGLSAPPRAFLVPTLSHPTLCRRQAPLSFAASRSLLRPTSIEPADVRPAHAPGAAGHLTRTAFIPCPSSSHVAIPLHPWGSSERPIFPGDRIHLGYMACPISHTHTR